jgi:beta-N-acetylhexosaminidase
MGFDGVIITDALDMEAVADGRGIAGVADAAVRALSSGADLLCLGSNFDGPMTTTVIDQIVDALDHDQLSLKSLERSRERIAGLHRPHTPPPTASTAARQVARRAIVIDGAVPEGPFVVLECRPRGSMASFNVTWGIADELRDRGWPVALVTPSDQIESICAAELGADGRLPVLVVVRNAGVDPWQVTVIDTAVRARPGSVVVVELGWPCLDSTAVTTVVSHGAARSSARAVLDLLGAKES